MTRLLLLLLLLAGLLPASAQQGSLVVKKKWKSVRSYIRGEYISVQTTRGRREGFIGGFRGDTVFIGREIVRLTEITRIYVPREEIRRIRPSAREWAWIALGSALTSYGLTLNGQATVKEAVTAGVAIPMTPIVYGYLRSKIRFRRKQYRIGRRFSVQAYSFYVGGR
ncbi:MAG TPA: hypothetical protein VHK69_17030 [Chitinophagaceae bacterium]|jgi:hypothetical protein|nr:hypothetical protein [Chitinophagaceae bacterium]